MISIQGFTQLQKPHRMFIVDYLDMINMFEFHIETYQGQKDDLPIQNTDLWIESYIDIVPELQEFRDLVHREMERLGVKKHPYYVYQKKYNHYYYSNKGTIERFRDSVSKDNNKPKP